MKILSVILALALDIIPAGEAFLRPLQQRDSLLIADQVKYGVVLSDNAAVDLQNASAVSLPEFKDICSDTLVLVRNWQLDTVSARKKTTVEASVILAPFEEGVYSLPDIPVAVIREDGVDTLLFKGVEMKVFTMPVDTASFEPFDIKDQIRYPLTAAEVLSYGGLGLLGIGLVVLVILLAGMLSRRSRPEQVQKKDPAHIVALRELDRYRSDKYWAPEKQKEYYSGITDTLKEYIDARYGVDAPEMTTAELFAALKDDSGIPAALLSELKALFETADFVKFAKATASQEENAGALPLAVRFVTSTYQASLEAEAAGGEEAARK